MDKYFSSLTLLSLVLTFGAYQLALLCQKKTRSALCNPILLSGVIVIGILLLTKTKPEVYLESTGIVTWLLTPATVSLAVPMYRQLKQLKGNLTAIFAGIIGGAAAGLGAILLLCAVFALDRQLTVSLLPKSITVAIGSVLAEQNGGIPALTSVVIAVTGVIGNLAGPGMCKLFRLHDPISQGVAYGTASHVIGTARASQIDPLTGAVSSLSLVVAGVLTAFVFPLLCMMI